MGSYFYNRDLSGDKVIDTLKQVLFERSHFPWNFSPLVFQNCWSIVFSCESYLPRCIFTHALFLITKTPPFSRPSLPVPAALEQIQNVTVEEGRNVLKGCNVAAGTPPLNVFWKNVKTGHVTEGKLLTIINIRRNQSGEYRCIANNTCGNESTMMFINVQCKIILMASFDSSLYWQGLVMLNFSPSYVSKHKAIIMLFIVVIHGSIICAKTRVSILL